MMTSTEIDPMSILIIIFFIGWVIISYISEKMREKEFENKMRIEREKEEGKELMIGNIFRPLVKEYIDSTNYDQYTNYQIYDHITNNSLYHISNVEQFNNCRKFIAEYMINTKKYNVSFIPHSVHSFIIEETYTIDIVEKRKRKIEKLKQNIENKYNFK